MEIPDNYKVLFLQGGASSQFAMVPLNLMTKNRKADYVLSGQFSTKAYKEAARFGDCKVVASSKEQNFSRIPDLDPKEFRPDADYFHICMNNTIYGTVFHALPETGDCLLYTSCFFDSATCTVISDAPARTEFCTMSITFSESSRMAYAVYFARILSTSSRCV